MMNNTETRRPMRVTIFDLMQTYDDNFEIQIKLFCKEVYDELKSMTTDLSTRYGKSRFAVPWKYELKRDDDYNVKKIIYEAQYIFDSKFEDYLKDSKKVHSMIENELQQWIDVLSISMDLGTVKIDTHITNPDCVQERMVILTITFSKEGES